MTCFFFTMVGTDGGPEITKIEENGNITRLFENEFETVAVQSVDLGSNRSQKQSKPINAVTPGLGTSV